MRFYLDDDVGSERIVRAALRLGLDVITSTAAGHSGAVDRIHLARAAEMGRCIVTRNYPDFDRLTRQFQREGIPHAGVLFVPSSLPNEAFGAIARAFKAYDDAHPEGMPPYMVDYLSPTD